MTTASIELERFKKRSNVGRGGWTLVTTCWLDDEDGYVTMVSRMLDCRYQPWEWHLSMTEEEARSAHHAAVRRHPETGAPAPRAPREMRDGRCARCGDRETADREEGCGS